MNEQYTREVGTKNQEYKNSYNLKQDIFWDTWYKKLEKMQEEMDKKSHPLETMNRGSFNAFARADGNHI